MKKEIIFPSIIIGIGIIIVVSGFLYQETYNQNCIKDDGKVTGFLSCTRVFEDFSDPILSKYGVEYDELVTRKVLVIAQVATEIIPERNCHKFSEDESKNLPENLKSDMQNSLRDLEYEYDSVDGFLDRYASELSIEDAFTFLEKYDFQLYSKKVEGTTLPKIQDTAYVFECIFEHENHQYRIELEFESHYLGYGRLVFVNFTNNEQGLPIIENDNIVLYTGGFNQTVVFQNKLDHEVTLEMINLPTSEESTYGVPEKTVIPSGKVWSHFFKKFGPEGDLVYQFNTKPDNLHGIVILKNFPGCMTEKEVRSLYSQVEVYPTFPKYIPEGYSFECGVHNFNSAVYLVFWTDELREKFDDKVNAATNMEFLADGGLSIYFHNDYVLSNWVENLNYDKFDKAKEKAEHPQATTLTIKDNPAVMIKEYFKKSGETKSFNELKVFSDNEIWYYIRSGLPENELIKIAESLFSEPSEDPCPISYMDKDNAKTVRIPLRMDQFGLAYTKQIVTFEQAKNLIEVEDVSLPQYIPDCLLNQTIWVSDTDTFTKKFVMIYVLDKNLDYIKNTLHEYEDDGLTIIYRDVVKGEPYQRMKKIDEGFYLDLIPRNPENYGGAEIRAVIDDNWIQLKSKILDLPELEKIVYSIPR